jgi:hypothetical protein
MQSTTKTASQVTSVTATSSECAEIRDQRRLSTFRDKLNIHRRESSTDVPEQRDRGEFWGRSAVSRTPIRGIGKYGHSSKIQINSISLKPHFQAGMNNASVYDVCRPSALTAVK